MSPHAVLADLTAGMDTDASCVSENAFLPASPPTAVLSDPYYQPWERLAADLPALLKSGRLRDEVRQLPLLGTDRLVDEPEWRRAYSVLAFLAHAYIWGGKAPAQILPPPLTVPLLATARTLDLPPVATYAALNLWNYTTTTSGAALDDPDNLRALLTFTGTESESWFYMVSVAMEAAGGPAIPAVCQALEAIPLRDPAPIATALAALTDCICKLTALLGRMHEHCDPDVFYFQIRPFLAGSQNMQHVGLPRGVFYDEGDGRGAWAQFRGGSNGQSSLIQFLDLALGVEHASSGASSPDTPVLPAKTQAQTSFHHQVRAYMPGPHRRFLDSLRRQGSLRAFALQHRDCRAAYDVAVDALTGLRNTHLRIVARYIVMPSRRTSPASGVQNLATASANDDERLTGTGGTALMPFLRKARDETMAVRDDRVQS